MVSGRPRPDDFVTDAATPEHAANMAPELAGAEVAAGLRKAASLVSCADSRVDGVAYGTEEIDVLALYDRFADYVWRSLRRLGVHSNDLPDAAQDVFLVVHRRIDSFEYRSKPKTWIFGIALRVAKLYRRKGARQRARIAADETSLVCSRSTPEEANANLQAAELVQGLLDGLDDDQREVFVLVELEHMSVPEVAEAVGIPLNTAYSRLRLARADMEESLRRHKAKDGWRCR